MKPICGFGSTRHSLLTEAVADSSSPKLRTVARGRGNILAQCLFHFEAGSHSRRVEGLGAVLAHSGRTHDRHTWVGSCQGVKRGGREVRSKKSFNANSPRRVGPEH